MTQPNDSPPQDNLSPESVYFQHLRHRLLTQAEETNYLTRAQAGDRSAIEALVIHNQRLVVAIAHRYHNPRITGDLELMDLVQLGNKGLLTAIDRFDLQSGNRFSTYATYWIRAEIRRGGMMQGYPDARTAREGDTVYRIRKAISQHLKEYRHPPTTQEIMALTGLTQYMVTDHIRYLVDPVRLDQTPSDSAGDYDDNVGERYIPDPDPGPEEQAITSILATRAVELLQHLTPSQSEVIILRFGLFGITPLTHKEIAQMRGVSRTRIQQIEIWALTRLRELIEEAP